MAELMIKLSRNLADSRSSLSSDSSSLLDRLVDSYGATINGPTGAVGESSQYFRIVGVEAEQQEKLRRDLERLEGVEAAYLKPSDEMP
jgi:hypothetical protein